MGVWTDRPLRRGAGLVLVGLVGLACAGLPSEIDFSEFSEEAEEVPAEAAPAPEPEEVGPTYFYLPGSDGVTNASYAVWEPGTRLFVGVDGTNLRSKASIKGEVLEKLNLGVEVEILEPVGDPVVLTGRRNVWYHIKTKVGVSGYVFGAVLSPLRVALFPEGDGEPLVAVVTFSPEFGPRLRMWQPRNGPLWSLDAKPPGRFRGGGVLTARSVPGASRPEVVVALCNTTSNECDETTLGVVDGQLKQLVPPVD